MKLAAFFAKVRDHYVDQFSEFVAREQASCKQGHAEVKFRIPEPTRLYERLVCVDFATNDAGVEVKFFKPELMLNFHPITGGWRAMRFQIEALRWDSVVIHHNCPEIPDSDLKDWFARWFDPQDLRHDPAAKFGFVVHSLSVERGRLEIDLGTAPTDALSDMFNLLERSGTTFVRIDGATPAPN